jgi:hypothetical protein
VHVPRARYVVLRAREAVSSPSQLRRSPLAAAVATHVGRRSARVARAGGARHARWVIGRAAHWRLWTTGQGGGNAALRNDGDRCSPGGAAGSRPFSAVRSPQRAAVQACRGGRPSPYRRDAGAADHTACQARLSTRAQASRTSRWQADGGRGATARPALRPLEAAASGWGQRFGRVVGRRRARPPKLRRTLRAPSPNSGAAIAALQPHATRNRLSPRRDPTKSFRCGDPPPVLKRPRFGWFGHPLGGHLS